MDSKRKCLGQVVSRTAMRFSLDHRKIVCAHEQRTQRELEEREKELAEKVRAATYAQIRTKVEADIDVLTARLPTQESEAAEAAADQAYLRERQMSLGYVNIFHCSAIQVAILHISSLHLWRQNCFFHNAVSVEVMTCYASILNILSCEPTSWCQCCHFLFVIWVTVFLLLCELSYWQVANLRKGQEFTSNWLEANCKIVKIADGDPRAVANSVAEIGRFCSRFHSGTPGKKPSLG